MPRDIPINHLPQPPIGGVLIERKLLEKTLSFMQLEQQARQRSKQLIRYAQKEARILQELACRDGFQQGMLYALEQVATYLSDSNLALASWQRLFEKQIREMLTVSLSHPETLLQVLDEWFSGLCPSDSSVNIELPEMMKARYSDLISQVTGDKSEIVRIGYHPGTSIIFRCGENIAEFSPMAFTEEAGRRLLARNIPDLNQSCCHLSRNALTSFAEYCQKLSGETGEHDPDK